MSVSHPRHLRTAAVTTALTTALSLAIAGLGTGPATGATGSRALPGAPTAPAAQHRLTATFDHQDATIQRGARFGVSGTVSTVSRTSAAAGAGAPARFTLEVTDATGRVLGTQAVRA